MTERDAFSFNSAQRGEVCGGGSEDEMQFSATFMCAARPVAAQVSPTLLDIKISLSAQPKTLKSPRIHQIGAFDADHQRGAASGASRIFWKRRSKTTSGSSVNLKDRDRAARAFDRLRLLGRAWDTRWGSR